MFVVLMTIASVIGLAKGVVYGKVLGAQALGYYGLALLVTQFGVGVCSWGIMSALNVQLPMAFGRSDPDVQEVADRSLGAVLVTSAITGVIYLAVITAVSPRDRNTWAALSLAALLTLVTVVFEFCLLMLRSEGRLVPLAKAYLARSLVAVALGAAAGAALGYLGVIAAELAALVLMIAVAGRRWLRLRVRRPRLSSAIWFMRWGAPLTVANLVVAATFTTDRAFVAASLSKSSLGQYTFASFVVIAWAAVLGMLAQSTAPRLFVEYGRGTELRQVQLISLRVTLQICALGFVGLAILLLARGWLRHHAFSGFDAALHVMPILYLGGLISILGFPGFLVSLRPKLAMLPAILGTVVAVVGGALLASRGAHLEAFAWLFTITQAITVVAKLGSLEWIVRRPRESDHRRPTAGVIPPG
jgi:O-antigen/teichoic acid export membrane protein